MGLDFICASEATRERNAQVNGASNYKRAATWQDTKQSR